MPTKTTNYNLIKPEQDEFYDIAVPNANMDKIDGALKTLQDAINTGVNEQEIAVIRGELAAHMADEVKHISAAQRTAWNAKLNASDLKDASTTQKGIVQLNNTVTSTSTVQAATANAVKTAYDRAESAFQSASSGKLVVRDAITGKGGTVAGGNAPSFQQLADGVNDLASKNDIGEITNIIAPFNTAIMGSGISYAGWAYTSDGFRYGLVPIYGSTVNLRKFNGAGTMVSNIVIPDLLHATFLWVNFKKDYIVIAKHDGATGNGNRTFSIRFYSYNLVLLGESLYYKPAGNPSNQNPIACSDEKDSALVGYVYGSESNNYGIRAINASGTVTQTVVSGFERPFTSGLWQLRDNLFHYSYNDSYGGLTYAALYRYNKRTGTWIYGSTGYNDHMGSITSIYRAFTLV